MTRIPPIPLIVLLLAICASLWGLAGSSPDQMPVHTFNSIRGNRIDAGDLTHRPVLVSFWSTSCVICRTEMPKLAGLYRHLHSRGLQIIAVAMPYDPPDQVVQVSSAEHFPYPVTLDLNSRIARAFGYIDATPTTFLIAPDGHVVFRHEGRLNLPALKNLLQSMLARPSTAGGAPHFGI